jgi:tRNA pseudouridine13 synthase
VGREQRSLLISAARSALFNAVCASRVVDGTWERGLEGDVFQLDGKGSIFGPVPVDDELAARLARGEVHATGPMWGAGDPPTAGDVAEREKSRAGTFGEIAGGLAGAGLRQERRSLRVMPRSLTFRWDADDHLALEFGLPPGSYATVVLRELARTQEPVR